MTFIELGANQGGLHLAMLTKWKFQKQKCPVQFKHKYIFHREFAFSFARIVLRSIKLLAFKGVVFFSKWVVSLSKDSLKKAGVAEQWQWPMFSHFQSSKRTEFYVHLFQQKKTNAFHVSTMANNKLLQLSSTTNMSCSTGRHHAGNKNWISKVHLKHSRILFILTKSVTRYWKSRNSNGWQIGGKAVCNRMEKSTHALNLAQLQLDTQGTVEAIKKQWSLHSFVHIGQFGAKF